MDMLVLLSKSLLDVYCFLKKCIYDGVIENQDVQCSRKETQMSYQWGLLCNLKFELTVSI